MARRARSLGEQADDDIAGLGDIVANLMALFILLTVFVLLARVTSDAAEGQQQSVAANAAGTFLPRTIEPLVRQGAFVVVTGEGFAVVNIAGLFDALMPATEGEPVSLPGGLFLGGPVSEAMRLRPPSSDHEFSLSYSFQVSDIPEEAAISADAPDAVLAELRARIPEGAPMDFFVYPDGLARFSPIYQSLTEAGECFRWQPWTRTVAAWRNEPNPIRIRPGSLLGRPGCPAT
ncbi:hypothetical protein ROA7023_03926 [Roseisalinus antarcticus]|uniref:Uncharacterized protein n=2 Tax=Roseisalinus antarcticus TaxID=254357 RepID=A0A1Y5TWP1_9RHOB|nr:hypothetical protein ROA7023_03926 [Roseisalinus antarcticus]